MPIEVLTRGELDRLIRETFTRLLEESGLSERLSNLELSVNELKLASSKQPSAPASKPLQQALMADLGDRARFLDINLESDPVTLRPRQWLRTEDFRSIVETVRRHGGVWSPEKRVFIISKAASK